MSVPSTPRGGFTKPVNVTTPTSPKVVWGTVAGLVAAVLAALLTSLIADPAGLGVDLPLWLVFLLNSAGPVVIGFLAAYAKRDPLRDAGYLESATVKPLGGFTKPV